MLRDDLQADFDSLLPGQDQPNRRTALKAALGVGYTAAAGPLANATSSRTRLSATTSPSRNILA